MIDEQTISTSQLWSDDITEKRKKYALLTNSIYINLWEINIFH